MWFVDSEAKGGAMRNSNDESRTLALQCNALRYPNNTRIHNKCWSLLRRKHNNGVQNEVTQSVQKFTFLTP